MSSCPAAKQSFAAPSDDTYSNSESSDSDTEYFISVKRMPHAAELE
jgi:hypothetical protein